MSHIQYTICRSGSYYYNRRVPKHAVQSYGKFIRCILSTDIHEAKAYAERLSFVLEGSWSGSSVNYKVDIPAIIRRRHLHCASRRVALENPRGQRVDRLVERTTVRAAAVD